MKCKVVFIANSAEIKRESELSETDFNQIKEKIIDKTLLFNPLSKDIASKVIKSSKSEFISKNINWIVEIIFYFHEIINIRTLQSILSNFEYFENIIDGSNLEDSHLTDIKKSIFLNVMVITQEYRKGNLNNETVKELTFNSKYIGSTNDVGIVDLLDANKKNLATKKTDTKSSLITGRYHNKKEEFDNSIFYFNGIESYIMHGFYDKKLFDESYQKWKNFYFPTSDFYDYERLYNFRDMDDKELVERQGAVLTSLESRKYSTIDLLKIYKLFLEFKKMELYLVEENLSKIMEKKIYNCFIEEENSDVFSYFHMLEEYKFNELCLLESNLKRLKRELEFIDTKLLVTAVFENRYEIIATYESRLEYKPVFEVIDSNMVDKYLLVNNNKAHNLMSYVRGKHFERESISNEVNRILHSIEKFDKSKLGKVDRFKLNQLVTELKQI
ncbi:hypothetical protein SAMN04487774_10829 [Enterococcus faecalis]|uniref:hypothetical protein n=1 Tax=Enterococcus faecalis TaxID=1351 RepID=UPI0008883FC0|nr:hypothetical protein [Enterococcus faecalis]SDN75800.1 hypothetical protein SAMN04487774_10829 [Enterococcus faecalis]